MFRSVRSALSLAVRVVARRRPTTRQSTVGILGRAVLEVVVWALKTEAEVRVPVIAVEVETRARTLEAEVLSTTLVKMIQVKAAEEALEQLERNATI